MVNFRVGSMFAGIGGICQGFLNQGHTIVWANEKDNAACKTYRNNYNDTYLVEEDICNINVTEIPNIDILAGGFPCQPFSIAGRQRGFKDRRGNMFFEIVKVLEVKQPKVVFLENVENLIRHDNGNTMKVIISTLESIGYSVK